MKKYSEEFKQSAVRRAQRGDKSVARVAREMDLAYMSLYNWIRADRQSRELQEDRVSKKSPNVVPILKYTSPPEGFPIELGDQLRAAVRTEVIKQVNLFFKEFVHGNAS